jgi:catechol 2,3-dioxygenase-like lactoylglutathione lyase family enzyme
VVVGLGCHRDVIVGEPTLLLSMGSGSPSLEWVKGASGSPRDRCRDPVGHVPGVDRQVEYWRMDRMSQARRFDHVGITVADLDSVMAFFVGLGLEVEGTRMFVEGEFLDTVIGIPGSRTEIVMLRPPDGGTRLELSSFVRPDHVPGSPAAMANELGLRNVAFEVDDLQAVVDRLAADGYGLVGGIGITSTSGAWPTCADRRGSSCPWPSASADAAVDA